MSNLRPGSERAVRSSPAWSRANAWILRAEGIALMVVSTYLYFHGEGSLWLFLLLILVPDVSILGYGIGIKTGTVCYNLFHNTVFPLILVLLSVSIMAPLLMQLAFIWLAHVGFDRAIGSGLKYPTHFRDTHLHRLQQGGHLSD